MKRFINKLLLPAVLALLVTGTLPAVAQTATYPTKPIRVVVPAGAGSTADILLRIVADRIGQPPRQPWVIDYKPGAGGIIGSEAVAKASPDGYTLLFTANNFIIAPSLFPHRVPYDVLRDFAPIGLVASADNLIVASAGSGIVSVPTLLDKARGSSTGLDYSSPLMGSAAHLTMEMLARKADIKLTHIPFKEAQQAMTETLAGRVPLTITGVANSLAQINAGKLVPIAVTGSHRSSFLPNVPTLAESGVQGIDVALWFGLYAPAKTPDAIVRWLNRELNAALALPELKDKLAAQSFEALGGSPEQLAATMMRQQPEFAKVIQEAGIKVD